MDGFLVVDKPVGITSHDVVARVRRLIGSKQVGHTGTLDPFATGVLVVACGAATKAIPYLNEELKAYRALLTLGATTDTQDYTGTTLLRRSIDGVTEQSFCQMVSTLVGLTSQIPPMYSALKRDGVPLYRLARNGQEVEREPRQIEISELTVDRFNAPEAEISVVCSKGTYVRTLAHDLGELLGCGAHLRELRRTASGSFRIDQAVTLDTLMNLAEQRQPLPFVKIIDALDHFPSLQISARAAEKSLNGLVSHELLATAGVAAGTFRLLAPSGGLLAIAQFQGVDGAVSGRLLRVFPELSALHG